MVNYINVSKMKKVSATFVLSDGSRRTITIQDQFYIDEQVSLMMKAFVYAKRTNNLEILKTTTLDKSIKDYLIKTGTIDG